MGFFLFDVVKVVWYLWVLLGSVVVVIVVVDDMVLFDGLFDGLELVVVCIVL